MRLAAITTTLLAAACSLQTDELATTSIECTSNQDGSTTCKEEEDRPDGDEDTPPGDDLVCSGTGCVAACEYTDDSFHCSITCENGLSCQQTCKEGTCEISCDCPDGGGGGGCEGEPTDECCRENPEDPACKPPCPDGSDECDPCPDGTENCEPEPCPDGSTDEECYCREHPDDPTCQPPCPADDPECCKEGEDCQP